MVDWLNTTFDAPPCSMEIFLHQLGRQVFGRPVTGVESGGLLGFSQRVELAVRVASRTVLVGCVAFGGEAQRGRWLLQLTGVGCSFVPDWQRVRDFLEGLDAKLTRVDLAVDLLNGEYTVDDAVDWYLIGGFTNRGRAPQTQQAGDWIGDGKSGRTFYVGSSKNGKLLRVYEKGREQGNPESPWVRFEVQFGNRDREIPFDALTNRDAFFVGAYPALTEVLDVAGEKIQTTRTSGEVSLSHLLYHARRTYGKLFDVLMRDSGVNSSTLVEEIRVIGFPRRLNPSSVEAGVEWADVSRLARGLQ